MISMSDTPITDMILYLKAAHFEKFGSVAQEVHIDLSTRMDLDKELSQRESLVYGRSPGGPLKTAFCFGMTIVTVTEASTVIKLK